MAQYIAVSPMKDRKAEGKTIQPGQRVDIPPEQAEALLAAGIIRKATRSDKPRRKKK